jgi:uncharacterized metal-binding protein
MPNPTKLIFACSGASDVGELSDRVARTLSRDGAGKMYCLSGLGSKLNNFIETTKNSSGMLVIDGCPMDCAKKCLENVGITSFDLLRITDLGFEKGKSPVTSETIQKVVEFGRQALVGE